jgi:hypothetical protein
VGLPKSAVSIQTPIQTLMGLPIEPPMGLRYRPDWTADGTAIQARWDCRWDYDTGPAGLPMGLPMGLPVCFVAGCGGLH